MIELNVWIRGHGLNDSAYRRLLRKIKREHPDAQIIERLGNKYYLTYEGLELLNKYKDNK